ncbi:hypothetical protein C882_2255 [Caenispirillum salinarum AK4]|uniref:Endonuclease/exonuclease/phosphatase domain-containing protein n=1 Tax=Caenispirillum salinarum AK4 TaxID=1238182 RepID=K9H7S8_9PROT|nr:endonuclease/exonuclease/phosphatase family protein [Caenispirillum salinarum]EKV26628.1 hypothetical protein C882_2255 [Caenispirillum salinarum AK4]
MALVTVAVLNARLWWPFDLLTHFRLQYVAAAAVLLVAALLLRAWPAAAILLTVAILHGWVIKDLWTAPTPEAPPGERLRVVAANVLNANRTPDAVADFVARSDADVVILVDAVGPRWTQALEEIGGLYPHAAPDGWRNGAPALIFSRHPIWYDRVARRTAGKTPYLVTRLTVGERAVSVIGVHPTSPAPFDGDGSRARNQQLRQIAQTASGLDDPLIVAGDFNTTLWSPHAAALLDATGLRPAAHGHGWHATWPRWMPPGRIPIDHVLLRGPLTAERFGRGPAIGSDHYPVVADLVLAPRS